MTVSGRPEWPDDPVDAEAPSGLVGVLLARGAVLSRTSVCAWLVATASESRTTWAPATHCGDLPRVVRNFLAVSAHRRWGRRWSCRSTSSSGPWTTPAAWATNPPEQADFIYTRGHLGPWRGPSAIRFGRDGQPFYMSGPNDNPTGVLRQLERSVGRASSTT